MSIVGTWNLSINTPMGKLASTLILNSDGTGVTSSQMGSSEINDAKINGDGVTFTVKLEVMGQTTVLKATATAVGDSITGRYESPTGISEFAGQRAS